MYETNKQQIDKLSEELAITYMKNMGYKDTPTIFTKRFLDAKKEISECLNKNQQ